MMRILFLPGSWNLARNIVATLQGEGHSVTFVLGAEDLQKAGHALNYDLLIVDLGFSGFDVCRFLESQAHFNQKERTILFATKANRLLRALSLGYGVEQCLAEPFARDDFIEKLRFHEQKLQERLDFEAGLSKSPPPIEEPSSSSPHFVPKRN